VYPVKVADRQKGFNYSTMIIAAISTMMTAATNASQFLFAKILIELFFANY
jgi:hypothetical protein